MRRRKPFGPLRLLRAGRGLFSAPSPNLRQAHQWMGVGDYAEAAEAFEKLANEAINNNSFHVPVMLIQAGRARLLMGSEQAGIKLMKNGLSLLAEEGRLIQFQRVSRRIVAELQARGLDRAVNEMMAFLAQHASATAETPTEPLNGTKRKILPTHCPSCGGPLKGDEVDWLDEATAECEFCGSPVRAE